MTCYHDASDLKLARPLATLAPRESQAFMSLKQAAGREDGAIPAKYRELISLAVALTTQCAYCIDVHTKDAAKAGVSREELAEVAFITASLRAGAAVGHGLMALKLFDGHLAATAGS